MYDQLKGSIDKRNVFVNTKTKFKIENKEFLMMFFKRLLNFYCWFDGAEDDLIDSSNCDSIQVLNELIIAHERFQLSLDVHKKEFEELKKQDLKIKSLEVDPNIFSYFKEVIVI